jgi:hypothetical protein
VFKFQRKPNSVTLMLVLKTSMRHWKTRKLYMRINQQIYRAGCCLKIWELLSWSGNQDIAIGPHLQFNLVHEWKVKVKLSQCFNSAPRHKGVLGEWMYSSTHSLTSALDGGEWAASCPGHFTPREKAPGTHWIGGWVDPRPFWTRWWRENFPAPAGNRTVEPPRSSSP